MKVDRPSLAILVSHPIQYFAPLYKQVASLDSVDLMVVFRTRVGLDEYHDPGFGQSISWDIPLLDGYDHYFLSKKTSVVGIEFSVLPWLIMKRPDVLLLHGYSQATNLLAMTVAKLLGIKVLMRGDTHIPSGGLPRGWKTRIKRLVFQRIDGFITIGKKNREYYQAFGAPTEKLYFSPFAVRNEFFSLSTYERLVARKAFRRRLATPDAAVVVLVASKLTPRKRVQDVIAAFRQIAQELPNLWLWVAGSGPEQEMLKQKAVGLDCIRFLGFQNQSALPELYAASDIFVLPSEDEPWGLAVNEVMAAGLPVVVTDDVGATPDLVEGKDTGMVYPVGDIDSLTSALRSLEANPSLRNRMGRNAQALIANWNIEKSATGIVQAVHSCLS